MVEQRNPNLEVIQLAVEYLRPLLHQIALLGGAATGLLLTDPGAAPVRGTFDVDVIVEISSYHEYLKFEGQLRQLGFKESPEDNLICRWRKDRLILDVMPTEESVLGFGNRWYAPALKNAEWISFGSDRIRVITAPYFLAPKIEAFHGRGNGDYLASRDIEDIIAVVDGRPELASEVAVGEPELKRYLRVEISRLLNDPNFTEAIPGHLLPDEASQERRLEILQRLHSIAENAI